MGTIAEQLKQRRSVRKYNKQPVPIGLLFQILQTASYAPSAHNSQPWRFVLVTDNQTKKDLAEAMAKAWLKQLEKENIPKERLFSNVNASIERFSSAPALVIACLSMENMDNYPDSTRQSCEHDMAVQSVAAAIQNMLLSAHFEGLGACWYCAPLFCKEEVRQTLEIPEKIEPQALITLGYPSETPKTRPTRMPFEETFFLNKWGTTKG